MHFKFFPAFFDCPTKISFVEQEENEKIELFLRRHFITNIPWIVVSVLGFFLPLILVSVDQVFNINLVPQLPIKIITGALIVYYLLLLAYIFENFLFWYYNIYVVTNLHLVDVELISILSRSIKEIELRDIEDITSKIGGIIRSLFNFGTVTIKTAAQKEEVSFDEVPKPDLVADRISDLSKKAGEGDNP